MPQTLDPVGEQQQRAEHDHRALEGDHGRDRVARVRALRAALDGQTEEREADRGQPDAHPLALAELEPEPAVREHGEEDEPAGDHGLHQREGRQRQRGDVQDPGDERHGEADRPPLGGEQPRGAAQRVADVDLGRRDRAPVLPEEGQVGGEGAAKREQESDLYGHLRRKRNRLDGSSGRAALARCSRSRRRTLRLDEIPTHSTSVQVG